MAMTHPTDQANAERIELPGGWYFTPPVVIDRRIMRVLWRKDACGGTDMGLWTDANARAFAAALTPDPVTMKEVEGLKDALEELISAARGDGWYAAKDDLDHAATCADDVEQKRAALLAKIAPAGQQVPEELREDIDTLCEMTEENVDLDYCPDHPDLCNSSACREFGCVRDRLKRLRSFISTSPAVADGGWEPPSGWRLVPVKATIEMFAAWGREAQNSLQESYRAMLSAAPAPPQQQPAAPGQNGEGR